MVLIIWGSLGFSFLYPPPSSFSFTPCFSMPDGCGCSSSCPPQFPTPGTPCPAFSSLPARYWVCKGRDCKGRDCKVRRHHAVKCPKLSVTQMTGDPNHAAPIPDLALGTPVSPGPERIECFLVVKKKSIIILIRLTLEKVSLRKGLSTIGSGCPWQCLNHHPSRYLKAI